VQYGHMDHAKLASELLKSLRGKRSQSGFSRRLGYSSNVQYLWESGRAFPRASRFFQIAQSIGLEPDAAVGRLYASRPAWLDAGGLTTPAGIAALLADLKGNRSTLEVARTSEQSRFAVARWLKAEAEPRLPDFLRLIDALTLRLLDFLEGIVDPSKLASVAPVWQRLQAARRTAYEVPWSHAVLRALELEEYAQLAVHVPGWIAARVGITREEEERGLQLLRASGQIRRRRGRFEVVETTAVDTRRDSAGARQLREFWAREAVRRLEADPDLPFAYNLFSVSHADLERIRSLQRSYFRELRAIVATSRPAQAVALVTMALVELGRD
jgi:transcriptional regulator with XRE-family HTH domain